MATTARTGAEVQEWVRALLDRRSELFGVSETAQVLADEVIERGERMADASISITTLETEGLKRSARSWELTAVAGRLLLRLGIFVERSSGFVCGQRLRRFGTLFQRRQAIS